MRKRISVAAAIRGLAAIRMMPRYELAGRARVPPSRLGRMLSEKEPMPESVAQRLRQILKQPNTGRDIGAI